MEKDRFITASEIGSYTFCRRAWRLNQDGAPSTLGPERTAGVKLHQQHGDRVRRAEIFVGGLSTALYIAAILLTAVALWLGLG